MRRTQSKRGTPPNIALTWEADLSPLPIAIDDDAAARPALLLVVADGFILTGDLVGHPSAAPEDVAGLLAGAIHAAAVSTGRSPDVVHVRHPAVAERLGALLAGSGSKVASVPALPHLDEALAGFRSMVLGQADGAGPSPRAASPETWAGWALPNEQIARVFSAAARYFRAAPWSNITNEDILRTTVRGGGTWSGSVMGMAGQEFGLALYERDEDLLALLASDPDYPEQVMAEISGSVISLSYNARNELPPPMRREIRDARWEVAGPRAYPSMMTINTPGGGVTTRQIDDLIALLDAIASFATEHEPMLSGRVPQRYPIRWRSSDGEVSIDFHGAPDRPG